MKTNRYVTQSAVVLGLFALLTVPQVLGLSLIHISYDSELNEIIPDDDLDDVELSEEDDDDDYEDESND